MTEPVSEAWTEEATVLEWDSADRTTETSWVRLWEANVHMDKSDHTPG